MQELKAKSSTVNEMEIRGLYVVGYAQIDTAENYLLDQGTAYPYKVYDAYGPDGGLPLAKFKASSLEIIPETRRPSLSCMPSSAKTLT